MPVTRMGLEMAKGVFPVHGVDEHGKVVLKRHLARPQGLAFFANRPPCLIGLEAGGVATTGHGS